MPYSDDDWINFGADFEAIGARLAIAKQNAFSIRVLLLASLSILGVIGYILFRLFA